MSPILVRPVREQLEHDRVIRLLQAKYKRKSEVAINPGSHQAMPVGTGTSAWYPDLVLYASEKNRKVLGVVEVETAESVNNLEAMSQWAAFSRLKLPFHLYVPISYIDVARRLCQDLQLAPPELWSYQAIGDQIRFALVQRGEYGELKISRPAAAPPVAAEKPEAKPAPRPRPAAAAARPSPAAARPAAAATSGRKTAAAAKAAPPARKAAPAKAKPAPRSARPAKKAAAPARAKRR